MILIKKDRKLKKLVDEIWKEIPGSKGKYLISNYGRVKSLHFNKKDGLILKNNNLKGYNAVYLQNVNYSRYIHKIVALTWLDPPTKEQTIVTHLDGNLKNNYYKNLKWITKEEAHKKYSDKMIERGKRLSRKQLTTTSKLKEHDVKHIKTMLNRGVTQNVIAKLFKVSEMQISRIKRGENWGDVQPID